MPKIPTPDPLTVTQLRVLGELVSGNALRRDSIAMQAGSAAALAGLASRGLVSSTDLEMDGGGTERVWLITGAGKAALGKAAPPAQRSEAEPVEMPKITAIAPWFGATRMYASAVGEACRGAVRVCIPFAGSMTEVPAILAAGARAVTCNDAHGHLINMARVMADARLGPRLYRRLRRRQVLVAPAP